ncbi:hypothetical protein INR49_001883, partial [Caranx melampygus]
MKSSERQKTMCLNCLSLGVFFPMIWSMGLWSLATPSAAEGVSTVPLPAASPPSTSTAQHEASGDVSEGGSESSGDFYQRFLKYHTVNTNLLFTDPDLHSHAKHYLEYITVLQMQLSKGVSKEIVAKHDKILRGDRSTTTADCWAVLRAAKNDFLGIIGKIFESAPTQHPAGVFQVPPGPILPGGHCSAEAPSEAWCGGAHDLRDQLKNTKRFKKTPEGDKVEENPQERYSVPQVTSQVARWVFETMEKSLVADYLTHSTATAEKHYRMKKGASLLKGYKIILALGAEASGESSEETAKTMQPHNPQLDFQAIWDNFQQDHPVTVDGTVPGLATRNEASKEHQRKLYERWMKSQLKLRCSMSSGWKTNIPSVSSVLNERKPTGSLEDIPFSTGIRRLVSNQNWKGLKLVNIEGKGKGILAGRKSVITMVPSSQ